MNRPGYGINNQRRIIVFKYYHHLRYYKKINDGITVPLVIWLTWNQIQRQRTERRNRWRRNNES